MKLYLTAGLLFTVTHMSSPCIYQFACSVLNYVGVQKYDSDMILKKRRQEETIRALTPEAIINTNIEELCSAFKRRRLSYHQLRSELIGLYDRWYEDIDPEKRDKLFQIILPAVKMRDALKEKHATQQIDRLPTPKKGGLRRSPAGNFSPLHGTCTHDPSLSRVYSERTLLT